jgi:signal transduction histidine kinase
MRMPAATFFAGKFSSLRSRLVALVLVAALPLLLLGTVAVVQALYYHRGVAAERTRETARALGLALDRELVSIETTLETLAASPQLTADDLQGFYAHAVAAGRVHRGWCVLFDRDNRQILNTLRPFGAPLPMGGNPAGVRQVFATGRVHTSDAFIGRLAKRLIVVVYVPVFRDGAVRYVLGMGFGLERFAQLLAEQHPPPGWIARIVDRKGIMLARTLNPEQSTGTPLQADLLARVQGAPDGEGWVEGMTREGIPVYDAFARSQRSGWAILIGAPRSEFNAELWRSFAFMGAGGLLLVLVLAVALEIARRTIRPIEALARAVERGDQTPLPPSALAPSEVQGLHRALARAADLRRDYLAERERRTQEEAASRAKDEFLALLGHELRNPLAALMNAVQLLEITSPDDKRAGHARTALSRQSHHLARLVDDLLDVARFSTGKIALVRQPCDLAEVTRQALEGQAASGASAGHVVESVLDEVWVDGDETRLRQVCDNLLGNAFKYTPAGGRVRVVVRAEGESAELSIADTGVGIEPRLLPRMFELFVQGERGLERSQGGLGIGLTLVRRLAELHGGTVEAHSGGPGLGSKFTVRLPRIAAPVAHPVPSLPAEAARPRRRILLVEDNTDARETLRDLLELHGHEVHEAASGPDGVEMALRLRPDLSLIDIGLPELDGYEVARRIRASVEGHTLQLVALTGYGQPEDRRRAEEAGFDEHLAKPIAPDRLAALIAATRA